MKIRDAKPGDVLRDRDGDVWVRTESAALVMWTTGEDAPRMPNAHDLDAAEKFGPFVRLVPEREGE